MMLSRLRASSNGISIVLVQHTAKLGRTQQATEPPDDGSFGMHYAQSLGPSTELGGNRQ